MTTVLLIRHGRTSANTAGILAGRSSGVELDAVGERQVSDVGTRLAGVPLRAVVSSPLRRCRQTSQAVVQGRSDSCPVTIEQGLVECGYGEWTGKALRDLVKDKLWSTVQTQPSAVRFPGGESMTEMSSRAVNAIRSWDVRMGTEHGPHAVWAAVSHGDVIKAILADALGMHLDAFQRILVDPASVSIVRYTDSRPYVVTVNSTNADLGQLLQPPPKKPRSRRKAADDAPVGGGLGAGGDALTEPATGTAPVD
ncbi:MSMEG_4193 family putative phosphomutase [uncultured Friedmanniella sp.]|uniref:MSMEG_4193 family putative phosphomutase n=1 Tax=uncultured Friedmanniella sp. TaxID=335381 RepID=UPI0035CAB8E1